MTRIPYRDTWTVVTDRTYTIRSDRWMAHPRSSEAPDSALQDFMAVGLAIAVLLLIFALCSLVPGPVGG